MMLSLLLFFPLLAAIAVLFSGTRAKHIALGATILEFLISISLVFKFLPDGGTQFVENYWWVQGLGISYHVGMDGISLLLVLLTTFLLPLIILSSFQHKHKNPGLFYFLILVMQSALLGVFVSLDAFLFYVFWELALIPIYLICLVWGGKDRVRITLKFFIYTLFGSLLMLVALIWLWTQTPGNHSFELSSFYALNIDPANQTWLFWALFLAFAIKIPIFPFHTWQPDTYTDSPTAGTMLLSGIMLKMGIYGLLRWMLPVIPEGVHEWSNIAILLCVIGIVYASLIAWVQKDFKRLIAYSSIAHVGLIAAGVFSLSFQGVHGSVFQMLSHGVNVVGLFFIADIIERRTQTRDLDALGGIRLVAPGFSTYFIIVLLASIALPLTNGFVGEFLLLNGLYQYSTPAAVLAGLTVIFGAVYMLNAYRKIVLGEAAASTQSFTELNTNEKLVLIPIVVLIFWMGIYPDFFLKISEPSVKDLRDIIYSASGFSSN
ncbi:MAG: NADH-quinone oxidoreductase subunit M [Bacteroidetes bacterium]|nr:MAG: NADH-quinone oxidoreductase subunit M [Bacteroidota bacterium]